MSIKKKVSKADFEKLPGDLQKEYKLDASGDYVLDVEGEEDVSGLKKKVDELLAEKKEANRKQKEAEEAAKTAKEEKARKDGDVAALDESYKTKINELETGYKSQIATFQKLIHDLTVGSAASTMASKLALPGSAEVLLPHIKNRLSVEMNDKGEPSVRVLDLQGKPSAATIADLEKEIVGNKAFSPLIQASRASGGGHHQGNGGGGASVVGKIDGTPAERAEYFKQKHNLSD